MKCSLHWLSNNLISNQYVLGKNGLGRVDGRSCRQNCNRYSAIYSSVIVHLQEFIRVRVE